MYYILSCKAVSHSSSKNKQVSPKKYSVEKIFIYSLLFVVNVLVSVACFNIPPDEIVVVVGTCMFFQLSSSSLYTSLHDNSYES